MILPILAACILILAVMAGIYLSQYYKADAEAVRVLHSDSEGVQVVRTDYGWLFDGPSEQAAFVFYPGAKVEETAYAPLLHRIASGTMDVCLVKMPFHLAVFDSGAAGEVMAQHSYERWYIGGHSLGGAMAARYAEDHGEDFAGLILFAAYPTKPLPGDMKEVLLVGSEDRVIRREKLREARLYAPEDYTEYVIRGGNHAQFGSYGQQKGDGKALITAEDQVGESVRVIKENLSE